MISFEEFSNYFVERAKDYMPKEYQGGEIVVSKYLKYNGQELHSVCLQAPGQKIAPTLYLEDMYKCIRNGMSVNEVVEGFANELIPDARHTPDFKTDDFRDFDKMKDKVYLHVVNRKGCRELLSMHPYKVTGNLAKMYIMEVAPNCGAKISNELMAKWGVDVDLLDRVATQNSVKDKGVNLQPLGLSMLFDTKSNLMDGITPLDTQEIYVLRSNESPHGAVAMFYPEVMQGIANRQDSDFYIIPSSIHEVMLCSKKHSMLSARELEDTLRTANREVVSEREQLDNRIYEYDRETKEITIVPEAREKRKDIER